MEQPKASTYVTRSASSFATSELIVGHLSLNSAKARTGPLKNNHTMRTLRLTGFITSFNVVPLEIFRVNKGLYIHLREWATFPPQRSTIFDLSTYEGKVLPKALDRTTYQRKFLTIPPWLTLFNLGF
jgi:hypothetical protein